ncbi:disease resistance protein RUN1-like isoform X2 [Vicia villosa]|uniref:disease resistance protein RUN1-like isoform X2 n=1 Tax=Vicia villosa TaxID=3911 RepID=UPI00273AB4F9|nr:disease resistance protein RUN1-like isoform X2 [Vicia villosa]
MNKHSVITPRKFNGGGKLSPKQPISLDGIYMISKPQYAEIEIIVQDIIDTFGYKFSYLPNDLVGMLSPIEELEKCLLLDSVDDVRAVGICGMGGVGKTTLASVLYGKMKVSNHFEVCCLIDDVSNIFRKDGPIGVLKQILHQILGGEHREIYNLYDATNLIQCRLCRCRVLLVFDNVDHREQLEKLAVNRKSLVAGSRIIVVCRDAHILEEYGVDALYKVPLLNQTNSRQLFYRKAFKCDNIMSDTYKELENDIINYADGLPLVIKVLGSFLFGRSISEWKSALARLRESPNKVIMDALQFSLYGLEKMELQIFLDIACFFNGREEKFVKHVLNCCGCHPDIGLRVLVDKSLISISAERKIEMHAMLEGLGRKLVQLHSTEETRKWSRLWVHKDCYDVMSENMEKNVDAIVLNGNESDTEVLMADSLSNMSRLRLLILMGVKVLGSLNNLSNQLRYVEWTSYPFMYLPSSFQPNQLVELILKYSSIKQLWEGKKNLPNLRTLDLSYSENLIKMQDFGHVTNLERLNLEGCVKLVELDPSIGLAKKLVFLNLKNCTSLICIPNCIYHLNSLEYLNHCSCSEAFNNPCHLELLSLASLHALCELDISFCGLSQLPADTIGGLHCLQILNLGGNNFVTLPSLAQLSELAYLNLEHCMLLKSFPELPSPTAIKPSKYWRAGMYIFNCPELVDRQSCSSMTFSWMMQFVLANQESSSSFHWMEIVIPGSDIQSLFNNQKVGRSVTINPYHIMEDSNVIGVVCCVVFSVARREPTTTANGQKPVLYLSFRRDDKKVHFSILLDTTLVMDQSSHMWLTYFTKESFFNILKDIDNKDGNSMRIEAFIVDKGLGVKVNRCGYCWVDKQYPLPLN